MNALSLRELYAKCADEGVAGRCRINNICVFGGMLKYFLTDIINASLFTESYNYGSDTFAFDSLYCSFGIRFASDLNPRQEFCFVLVRNHYIRCRKKAVRHFFHRSGIDNNSRSA